MRRAMRTNRITITFITVLVMGCGLVLSGFASSAAARTIVGPHAMVGVSTHTETQIDAAVVQPVNYIAIGPVFGTATKETGYAAVGLDRVRYAAAARTT